MKLFIGSVVGRTEEVAHSQSMRELWVALTKQNIDFTDGTVVGDALVSRSRSIVASAFLRSDADVLLSIDSDIWFRPQDALRITEMAKSMDIVAGLYMTRNMNTQPALMLPEGEEITFAADSKPVKVPFVSTGFVAVHRRVFEALKPTVPLCHKGWNDRGADTSFWPFYMPYTMPWKGDGHIYLSEDWAFCQRARDAGFDCWLDPSIRLGHMGQTMYTLEDLIREPKSAPKRLTLLRGKDGELQTSVIEESPLVTA